MTGKWDLVVIEEEEEMELRLGLSIGRSFQKLKKSNSKSSGIDIKENDSRSSLSPVVDAVVLKSSENESNGGDLLDAQRKRELQAMRRRQEARKKREEKQQKKMIFGEGNEVSMNNNEVAWRRSSIDDKMLLEAQEIRCRVRDREAKEVEACRSERIVTKQNHLNLNSNPKPNPNPNPNFAAYGSPAFPVSPMQFSVHQLQYVPFTNGFGFPCMMPCWAPATSVSPADGLITDKNVFQPIACRTFRPFQIPYPNGNSNFAARCDSEQNEGKESGSSPTSSLSAVSEYQSASFQGRSSSDAKSHYSPSTSNGSPTQVSQVSNARGHSENGSSSPHMESTISNPRNSEEAISANESISVRNPIKPMKSRGAISPNEPMKLRESISANEKPISVIGPMKLEEPISRSESINKLTISTIDNSLPCLREDKEGDKKRETHAPRLSDMPCVSTTGNGTNGKTVTGFLYRYTKSEVSIVCVCHGSSFSPAEFIKHAGGTDITHPLRHIVVAPSSFK